MVIPINDAVVLGILTILHIVAIFFTWKIGKIFGSKSWNIVLIAFIILLLERIISFLELFEFISYSNTIILIDRFYLPMIFWILILVGMMRMYNRLGTSIDFEKKVKSIHNKIQKNKKQNSKTKIVGGYLDLTRDRNVVQE